MERLTKRITENTIELSAKANPFQFVNSPQRVHIKHPFWNVFNRLTEYEDLEEQGRLIKLPCKVGDTAYYVRREYLKDIDKWINAIDEVEVDSFIININLFVNVSMRIGNDIFRKTLTPYKTLFFSKEEGEKALAEMG